MKKHVYILLLIAVLAATAVVGFFAAGNAVQASRAVKELPIYCVEPSPDGKKYAALTFDAAWGADDTPTLVKILAEHNVQATFFVVGKWAEKYPEAVKLLAQNGNLVMNHSYDHAHFPRLTASQMAENANKASDAIEKLTGVRPTLFRCPYGDYDDATVKAMRDAGYYTIQWDVDSLDWKDLTASQITERVLPRVKSGSIILFHNDALHTPEALPGIIESLQKDGYELVTVDQLILKSNYYMDHTGMQCRDTSSVHSVS